MRVVLVYRQVGTFLDGNLLVVDLTKSSQLAPETGLGQQ